MTHMQTETTAKGSSSDEPILEVEDLHVHFRTRGVDVRAVNGISLHLHAGETLAILGESGSGKSASAQAIMGILDSPPAFVTGGQVRFRGTDVLALPEGERRAVRGASIAMVFQDALAALNPVHTVGTQVAEMFRARRGSGRREAMENAIELLDRVGIPDARRRAKDYPHQFSGGMRQRVMVAMAIALGPDVLIADEPTTALDVTVQAQIMELLGQLQHDTGMALLLITHDLGVVNETADRVAVMYAGRIVEEGRTADVLTRPAHPYTAGLMESVPRAEGEGERLRPITGSPPNLAAIPTGCAFHPRCPIADVERATRDAACATQLPLLQPTESDRSAACHYHAEVLGA